MIDNVRYRFEKKALQILEYFILTTKIKTKFIWKIFSFTVNVLFKIRILNNEMLENRKRDVTNMLSKTKYKNTFLLLKSRVIHGENFYLTFPKILT